MAVVLVVSSSAVEHLAVKRMTLPSSKLVATWTMLRTVLAKVHGLVQDSTYVHGLVGILGTLGTGLVILVLESFALVMLLLIRLLLSIGCWTARLAQLGLSIL